MLVAQLCPTLCDPMDCSPTGSSVHGILQAIIMEWVTMPFSRGSFCPCIDLRSRALQAYSLPSEPPGSPWLLRHQLQRHSSQTNIFQVYDTDASKHLDKKPDCTCSWSSPLRKNASGNPDKGHFKWPHFSVSIPKFLLLYFKLISKEWTCKS